MDAATAQDKGTDQRIGFSLPVWETGWHRTLSGEIGVGFAFKIMEERGPPGPDNLQAIITNYVIPTQRRLSAKVLPFLAGEPKQEEVAKAYAAFAAEIENHGLAIRAGFLITETVGGSSWLTILNGVGQCLYDTLACPELDMLPNAKELLLIAISYSLDEIGNSYSSEEFLRYRLNRALPFPVIDEFSAMPSTMRFGELNSAQYTQSQDNFRGQIKSLVDTLNDPEHGLIARFGRGEVGADLQAFLKDTVQQVGLHTRWPVARLMLHSGPEFFSAIESLEDSLYGRPNITQLIAALKKVTDYQRQTLLPLQLDSFAAQVSP